MRREFPNKVKAEIVLRAAQPDGIIKCEGCRLVLGKKLHHIDHTLPEGLLVDKSRPLTAADGKLLGWDCCHKPKTAVDVGQIAKSTRQRDKIGLGIKKRSSFPKAPPGYKWNWGQRRIVKETAR
jgi:hypothetical protein